MAFDLDFLDFHRRHQNSNIHINQSKNNCIGNLFKKMTFQFFTLQVALKIVNKTVNICSSN